MPKRFQVVVTDFLDETSVEEPVLGDLATLYTESAWGEEALSDRIESADALIVYHDIPHLGEPTFARAKRCRGLVRAGVGFNNIDLKATGSRGILVCNVPDYGTEEVADHSIMLILAVARRLRFCDQGIRDGRWDWRTAIPAPRLRGKTIGIVGCGRIGSATALRAKAFGLDVVFYDPYLPPGADKALGLRRTDTLEELLAQSLIVSLHCFLDAKSQHLIDANALSLMPPGSILINTARGPVVDQAALLDALDSGHLYGAGLDVFEREPIDEERLRLHPNVILTPHSAFYSVEGFVELRRKAAEEVRRILTGTPPRCLVNRSTLTDPRSVIGEPRC
jgi:phosphoglycerate dehydrogenase-like enzyme